MRGLRKIASILLFFVALGRVSGQVVVSGKVVDETKEGLPGATVKVLGKDSAFITGTVTDVEGRFELSLAPNTKFTLLFSSPVYFGRGKFVPVETQTANISLPTIALKETALELKEVQVTVTQTRGEQKGDTTAFNAGAFKTNPDATAEDLVKKMPGITYENGAIKVNGEAVQKVLVDGKPFFGDDPNATLKNLPADLIEKVQVFDKMSDQSQFTGFNDGDQQKTINLVTKKEKNQGQFGRVYGGAGLDQDQGTRYNTGAAVNSFNNKRRLSLLLLSNNVNQQNFSSSDITGAVGNSGQSGGGGRGGGNFGNSGSSALMATPQNGNNITNSAGFNYSDSWGSKVTVSGSYFYNNTNNRNSSYSTRNYFTGNDLVYKQNTSTSSINQNHRANFRLEYAIDSANKLTLTPSFSTQDNRSTSALLASNMSGGNLLSNTETNSKNNNLGYDFNNNLLYQHKFKKTGRTVSLNVSTSLGERYNNGSYYSLNAYFDTSSTGLDQLFNTYGYTKKVTANLAYTEPLDKYSQLQFNYNPSLTYGKSDKKTEDYNALSNEYDAFNPTLSNKFDNDYMAQKGGLSYRYNKEKLNMSYGVDAQQSVLNGRQVFPISYTIAQTFNNLLPNAMLNYKFSKQKNLRVNYRTSTNIPSLSQLQNVVDISNPLQVRSGNPSLRQTFENNLSLRFGGFDSKTSRNAMIFVNGSNTSDYISNATYILTSDSVIQGYTVKAGSQLTKPINLSGYYTARAFFVYGFPLTKLKSNLNFNGGLNYFHTPSIINYVLNNSNNYGYSAGAFIGSNISQDLDFSLGYNGNYNIVRNDVFRQSDNAYFTHTATFKINWIFWKGVVINTDLSHTLYNGLSSSFNQQYLLWNAYIGYKFLKNKSLEAKLSMFDILNQNRSINRNITGAYTEDSYTSVLRRYAMLTLTYTLKNFKSGTAPKIENPPGPPGGFPPGMRPPGGGNGPGGGN